MTGLIFEAAQTRAFGTVDEVRKITIWEFFHYIGYIRAQQKYASLLHRK